MSQETELLRKLYAAFNRREIETVLSQLDPDVDWPNGMEGGREHGRAAVRAYWTRQFALIQSNVEPVNFRTEEDGRILVDVHQVVHDNAGQLLSDQMVEHVYTIRDGLISHMEIRKAA
jgi:ketosteroid isomerase-like protein